MWKIGELIYPSVQTLEWVVMAPSVALYIHGSFNNMPQSALCLYTDICAMSCACDIALQCKGSLLNQCFNKALRCWKRRYECISFSFIIFWRKIGEQYLNWKKCLVFFFENFGHWLNCLINHCFFLIENYLKNSFLSSLIVCLTLFNTAVMLTILANCVCMASETDSDTLEWV